MPKIIVNDLMEGISQRCDNTSYTKQESLDAYEEIIEHCEAQREALREEVSREEAGRDMEESSDE